MTDFLSSRNNLQNSRKILEETKQNLSRVNQRISMAESSVNTLQRKRQDNDPGYLARLNKMQAELIEAKNNLAEAARKNSDARKDVNEKLRILEPFLDAREQLQSHFSNNIPFLLFPVRMETRFKTIKEKKELWVRVYPDECMVDGFESLLSTKEVNNVAQFWAQYYAAGDIGDPSDPDITVLEKQKDAWRMLVGAHGDGRSAWITQTLLPEPESIFPLGNDTTFILAIVTGDWPADTGIQNSITTLFTNIWNANGNAETITTIKSGFNSDNPLLNADDIISKYLPVNFGSNLPQGLTRETAVLEFAVVIFKDLDKKAGKEHSWSQASSVHILPERLALIRVLNNKTLPPVFGNVIPSPLPTSPDPSIDESEQFKATDGDLEFAANIAWVADFEKAIEIGMGFKLALEPSQENGFDQLYVLGVCLRNDDSSGKDALTELFNHHYYSRKGISLVPQGTPTNNTDTSDSGFTKKDFADKSFGPYFKKEQLFTTDTDWMTRKDGQWLAEFLGIDESVISKFLFSNGVDQCDARNMNIALWPATLGYVMESLMQDGFSKQTKDKTREFFTSFVSGRGPIPAIRIGNQPYGILPTSAFNRIQWPLQNTTDAVAVLLKDDFIKRLYGLLLKLNSYWVNMVTNVAQAKPDDEAPGQTIIDIIGLHPTSEEFHRRYLESLITIKNEIIYYKKNYEPFANEVAAMQDFLKTQLGYQSDVLPQLAAFVGMREDYKVKHLVDDVPLSEEKEIRPYATGNKNYISALIEQTLKSYGALRSGEGLSPIPEAELYRLLKYALENGYYHGGLGVADKHNLFSPALVALMKTEQPVMDQEYDGNFIESRYSLLYKADSKISPALNVSEKVRTALVNNETEEFTKHLSDQVKALGLLEHATTARLERAFVEHLDCCAYRLDAWKTGLLHKQLSEMRGNQPGNPNPVRQGIYLGAFGWLQDVRPEKKKILTNAELPEDVREDFNKDGKQLYYKDHANEGYIQAPSLNQAVTAAILRNGYISHGLQDNNNVLAVNLSSERIRLALSVIEGIQGGQSLAALLGYKLERSLHDHNELTVAGIDKYIYELRKQFPLNADKIRDTKLSSADPSFDPDNVPITAIEARNVVHGTDLVNYVKGRPGFPNEKYPYGLTMLAANNAITDAISAAVSQIIDIADAVADLAIAESVHQTMMGNYDRAAGVMDSYSKGNYPQHPEVIKTPRSGATLTHRVGIPIVYIPAAPAGSNPRAIAEPSLNSWLREVFPDMNNIVCLFTYKSRATNVEIPGEVSMKTLQLEPIDLVHILGNKESRSMQEMDDRIQQHIYSNLDPKLDENIKINYTAVSADPLKLTVFQVTPLVSSLRKLLLESAVLTPNDIAIPTEARKENNAIPELPAARVQNLIATLNDVIDTASLPGGILDYFTTLPDLDTASETELEDMRQKTDATIADLSTFLKNLTGFGIPQTGFGDLYMQRYSWFFSLKKKLKEVYDRWAANGDQFELLSANPTPTIEQLQEMERLISSSFTPADTITIGSVLAKKTPFVIELTNLKSKLDNAQNSVKDLLNDIRSIDFASYDLVIPDISQIVKAIPVFIIELRSRAINIKNNLLNKVIPASQKILTDLSTMSPADQARQIEASAKKILGDGFKMIPRYTIAADQLTELQNAWDNETNLLSYLKNDPEQNRLNPKEDWLHGIARVHEKMQQIENCILLQEAFEVTTNKLDLHAVQLPFKTLNYHWLAMPFPDDPNEVNLEDGNYLLYTAFSLSGISRPTDVCGILADEWTERIPQKEETTGIAFHYDRPNTEAPQTMLLVTPTQFNGNWKWEDLVDALIFTLGDAKCRLVEPQHFDKTNFARILPTLIGAESLDPKSIVLHNKAHYRL